MIRAFACLIMLCFGTQVAAQSLNVRAAQLLEGQLSGPGRTVVIEGFSGAVSTLAQIERLTIADGQGVWLVLEQAVLDWTASALLERRLQIEELSAARLTILRLPISDDSALPSAEASGFRIPDLPVAIRIGSLSVPVIELGAPVLGEAVTARLSASATLASGALTASLDAARSDAVGGAAQIALDFDPATQALAIDVDIAEPAGGVAARTLGLPGDPTVSLQIKGQGVLDAFTSTVRLATDGQERLGGQVTLTGSNDDGRQFQADLRGDIRPLLTADNRAFFGPDTAFVVSGIALGDGGFDLQQLELDTAGLQLEGQARIDAEGTPLAFALSGDLEGALPGTEVRVDDAALRLGFDAQAGPDWQLELDANTVQAPGAKIDTLELRGTGQITPAGDTPFAGRILADLRGLDLDDSDLQQAIGPRLNAATNVTAFADGRFALDAMQVTAQNVTATGSASGTPIDGAYSVSANLAAFAPDLSRFGALIAPLQAGTARADLSVAAILPGGTVTIAMNGVTDSLSIADKTADILLSPTTDFELSLRRDETGTTLNALSIANPQLSATASGQISGDAGALTVQARLEEPQGLLDGLPEGPITVSARASDLHASPKLAAVLRGLDDSEVALNAAIDGEAIAYDATFALPRVSSFAALTAPLRSGAIRGEVSGRFNTDTQRLEFALDAAAQALDVGIAQLAPLLIPETRVFVTGSREADGTLSVQALEVENPELFALASGSLSEDAGEVALQARLQDASVLMSDLPSGPVSLTASASDLRGTPEITAAARGLANSEVTVTAALANGVASYAVTYDVPRIAPFARLTSPLRSGTLQGDVSGTFDTETGRLGFALESVAGGLDLGIAQLAPLIAPQTRVSMVGMRTSDGAVTLQDGTISNRELDLSIQGDVLGTRRNLTASGRLRDLGVLVASLPGSVSFDGGLIGDTVSARVQNTSGITAALNGQIGLPGGAVSLNANGTAPLALASPFIGDRTLTGNASFDVSVNGPPSVSAISGQVSAASLRFADPALALVFSANTAEVQLQNGSALIDLRGQLGEAPASVQGQLGLLAPYRTALQFRFDGLQYAYSDLARFGMSGDIALQGDVQTQLLVSGDIALGAVEIRVPDSGLGGSAPVLDIRHVGLPSLVQRTLERADLIGPQSTSGSSLRIPLDVSIRAVEPIFVRGRGLDAEFGGALRIQGTVSDPEPIGRFELRRGRLSFLGQRLTLTEGAITAAGRLVPRLRIVAEAEAEDVTAQIAIDGPADAPDLILTSQPDLPQDEILARILFGRDVSSLSAFQVARLISSLATLSSGKPGLLDDTRMAFGVDDLDIRTDATTGEAELAIGQYISENIYSEVEVGAGGDAQINLNLDLTDNTRLRGSVNSDGGTGIGVFWQRDY